MSASQGMPSHGRPVLRAYRPADLDAVIAVYLDAIRRIAAQDYDRDQIEAWAQADRQAWALRCLGRPVWVAIIEDRVAGFAELEPDGHLDMMYVHSAYRRRGVATALLGQAECAAIAFGAPAIVTEASLTARPFFEKHGFQVVAEQQVALRGQTFTNFQMWKPMGGRRAPSAADRGVG